MSLEVFSNSRKKRHFACFQRSSLNKPVDAGPRELWAAVKTTADHSILAHPVLILTRLIDFFADISANVNYDVSEVNCYRQTTDVQLPLLYDFEIDQYLSKIKRTAAGCDDLPAWLFRNCSYELAGIVRTY